ncbi:hypothetical protein V1512DRAFT_246430 [Lipomyces arxii]|uniref:uncharacterized protein n=1 Tax=Lipomyces arxii TaxID=56418 RepID=UPI0034CF4961
MLESAISIVVMIVSRICMAIAALLMGPTIVLIVYDLIVYIYRIIAQYFQNQHTKIAQFQQKQGVTVYYRKLVRQRSPSKIKRPSR